MNKLFLFAIGSIISGYVAWRIRNNAEEHIAAECDRDKQRSYKKKTTTPNQRKQML